MLSELRQIGKDIVWACLYVGCKKVKPLVADTGMVVIGLGGGEDVEMLVKR